MYSTPSITAVARKKHRCTYCGEYILPGDTYTRWNSVDDGWFTSKMHPECLDDMDYWGDDEYIPYHSERPPKPVIAAPAAATADP
jgi:hypothetical protein